MSYFENSFENYWNFKKRQEIWGLRNLKKNLKTTKFAIGPLELHESLDYVFRKQWDFRIYDFNLESRIPTSRRLECQVAL